MQSWLDILGSFVIGGIVLVMIAGFSLRMNQSAQGFLTDTMTQREISTDAEDIDFYLYKIGYRKSGDKILNAEAAKIQYYSDYDNNGTMDTITYSAVNNTNGSITSTVPVMLKINNSQFQVYKVNSFYIVYFDSSGSIISSLKLQQQTNRNIIRSIKITAKFLSKEKVDDKFYLKEYKKIIRIKNI